MGLVSPLGNSVDVAWNNLVAGRSGIRLIDSYDVSGFPTKIAGLISDLDLDGYLSPKEAKKLDPFIHYGVVAALDAYRNAGIDTQREDPNRIGVCIGSGIGGIHNIEQNANKLHESGQSRRISPFLVPGTIINMVAGHVAIQLGLKGLNLSVVTACATGSHNIGMAARSIQFGDADIVLAGGAEYASGGVSFGGFCSARALSKRNDDPEAASRPWDRDRDGFVLSDGAGVLVLEDYDHAQARSANILAELTGFGMSADAWHITSPPDDGEGAARCMQAAMNDAEITAGDVGYINAHGTSTIAGDLAETQAIKSVFGEQAQQVAISSSKSMTGHLLGASGGIESIFCVKALQDSVVPPTINLHHAGYGCDLDYVPLEARNIPLQHVMNNSFGFGGTNATLIFSQLDRAQ